MNTPTVDRSWDRIEAWLARHASVTHGLLRPPALPEAVAAAELRLGVAFPADLKASLLRHDGVELQGGTLTLDFYGPLSGVEDIIGSTERLREIAEDPDLDEDEAELDEEERDEYAYWPPERLLITLGIGWQSSDGLFMVTRPGPHQGRIGRYFDETGSTFTAWPGLRQLLADFAAALEEGTPFYGQTPLAHEGRLIWDAHRTVVPDPVSPLGLAAGAPEPRVPAPARPKPGPPAPRPDGAYGVITVTGFASPAEPAPAPQPDVVFVAGITPGELLERLGAVPASTGPRSREQARLSAAAPWAAYRPMVRAGSCGGGWAYATQESGDPQFGRPEVLSGLSRGTRAVLLAKRGSEVRVTVVEDGAERPEAARLADSPHEDHGAGPQAKHLLGPAREYGERIGGDPWPESTAAYARLLASLAAEHGITRYPADDGEAPLASALLLPVLDDVPTEEYPVTSVRDFDLGALLDRTPPERMRAALAAQLARLASETGIDSYREITGALDRIRRDEPVELTAGGDLDLRIRTLAAEARAARGLLDAARYGADPAPVTEADLAAWSVRHSAAGALRAFLLLPLPAAAETILNRRLSVRWRDDLAADLAAEPDSCGV